MEDGIRDAAGARRLTPRERSLLGTTLLAVSRHMKTVNDLRRASGRNRGRREAAIAQALMDVHSSRGLWDAPFMLSNAIMAGVMPRETSRCGTSLFGIGRSSCIKAVDDVTTAILTAYPEKITIPSGRRLLQVLRVFSEKGFPNCFGAIDCTHIYVDKPANAPSENYFDRKQQFLVVAQVVVDHDMRIIDVFVDYPGCVHDQRVLRNSSLIRRAESGEIFNADPIVLPGGVRTTGYLLGDNGYAPRTWIVVPYRGSEKAGDVAWFDTRQKTTRGVVERAFGRLKGMWRLFLCHHKTNMNNLPQQFVVVCIIHNLLLEVGVAFDKGLLLERDRDGNPIPIDLGLQDLSRPVS
ncbi:hypothetical protein CBR_g3384 [Chara braunii]|uniref:DDE Tnp4 domain-containing protein n=1 Tax=Chara braunii TaxID=69332 RepID=A0A388JQT4_CHABU|nr:hypothetical protein CBR_g3384 [Chara braunii]|eukprot:GBG60141.1 hypothetical protein CBR_g3384 [Chara braunii]